MIKEKIFLVKKKYSNHKDFNGKLIEEYPCLEIELTKEVEKKISSKVIRTVIKNDWLDSDDSITMKFLKDCFEEVFKELKKLEGL